MKVESLSLPPGWKVSRVADAFDFTKKPRGLDLGKNGSEVPFFPMEQIPLGRIKVSDPTLKPVAKLGSGTYVENGDLVVAKITPSFENGKQGIVDIEADFAYATTEIIPIRCRPDQSDTLFLFFYLLHPEVRSDLAGKMEGSTGRQRLSKTILGNCLIPLPPLPEQKKIAHVLSTVQRAIEAQERIIQTTTELKKALMHKLFTEGTRGEPQKQTEIGPIPESWEVVRLGTLFAREPQNGLYKPKKDYGAGTQILRIDDFSNDGDVVTTARNRVILSVDEIRIYGLEAGDIVINRVNSLSHLGKTALIGSIDEALVFESNMMRFSVNEAMVRKEYVFKFLNSPLAKKQIVGSAKRAVAQSSISQGDVKTIRISKPSLAEQAEIAGALETIELKTVTATSKKGALQAIFRTLLRELMTAKVRVDDLELAEKKLFHDTP